MPSCCSGWAGPAGHPRRRLVPQLPDRTRLSSAREVMSSLMKTLRRWNWTVRGDRNSRVPISGLDRPSAASPAIWASCAVSSTVVVTARLPVVPPAARGARGPPPSRDCSIGHRARWPGARRFARVPVRAAGNQQVTHGTRSNLGTAREARPSHEAKRPARHGFAFPRLFACVASSPVRGRAAARSSIGEGQRLIQETLGPPEPQADNAESPATTGPKLCGAGELSLRNAYSANVPITP